MNKYEIFEIEKTEITVDVSMLFKEDSMFFNATEMAKPFNKSPSDFWKQSQNNDYLKSLITLYGGNKDSYVRTRTGRKYGGTWMAQKLALQFARWLSSDFGVKLDEWVLTRLKEEEKRKQDRLAAKTGYLELSIAVDNDHDPAKGYHFSNEANLINRIILGMDAKKFKELHEIENIRDSLSEFQIHAIKELQEIDTSFIKIGMEYQDRKEKLTEFYNKKVLS